MQRILMDKRWHVTEIRKVFRVFYCKLLVMQMPKSGFCKLIGLLQLMI
jgi:hypothetical protein